MRLEIDIPEHHYNNIMAIDSVCLGRVPYKGIIMYAINAIKQGKVLEQEPATKSDLGVDAISRQALLNATVKKSSIWSHITNSDGDNLEAIISKLPPVTPQLSSGLEKNSKKLEKDFGKSDCVSRADALALYCDKCGLYNCISKCASYRAVEKMPSVAPQEPRWIPVSERLPEDHKDVLAYLSSDRISICRYNSHKLPFCNNPIGWGYLHGIGFIDFKKEHVIAWMPLPQAYREVEE